MKSDVVCENRRVHAVYQGLRPDRVPLMLDLSHWYKKNRNVPFDLAGFSKVEKGLVDLHRQVGAVAYCEMGSFYSLEADDPEVRLETATEGGVFTTRVVTPLGTLQEERVFNPVSYSYGIRKYLLQSSDDFPVVEKLMSCLKARTKWERYEAWKNALGEWGFPYAQLPYSGSGYLMARYMDVEAAVYAVFDEPEKTERLINTVNACNLRILDTLLDGPFETLIISDNYDSNVQPKSFFDAYVRDYYTEVARRLHARGKYLAVHVDGESRGVLRWLTECGVDCADAVTPAPMFALSPKEQRAEAGPDLILSGGIPATVFGSTGSDAQFEDSVKRWLETRLTSSRLFMAAGDQVPPDAPFERIMRLRELVDEYGRY
ncbi:MAG: uroporphyrinogen decarboxylase family protein [Kiritimatiellae bacterium]|nr:uroporphyrinogen decarboxylase family protein [Kiritimatiellia bacterium]MDD5519255.1 uroporphyrinogen decarboxylase family protein [Kiritimatiellia bacterium]